MQPTQPIHDSRQKKEELFDINLKTPSGESQPHLSIHDSRKKGVAAWPLPKRLLLFYHNNKKIIKRITLFLLILVIVLFPVWSGTLIGNWIKDFIGTIINIVKTI